MLRRSSLLMLCLLLLGPAWSAFAASDPTLVGWWWFDEGAGTVASDSSGYGNNGTLENGAGWAPGYFRTAASFDGNDDYVRVPHNDTLTVDGEATVMAWINATRYTPSGQGWGGIIAKGNAVRSYSLYTTSSGVMHFSTGQPYIGSTSTGTVPLNEWVHVCGMIVNNGHSYFVNGQPAGTGGAGAVGPGSRDTEDVVIGRTQEGANRSFQGLIDDARIYRRGMTAAEIQTIMTGSDLITGAASEPSPAAGATDVPQDVALAWAAGEFAATHDVYFGTTFDDVNDADRANPKGVLASQGQTDTAYDPDGLLEFGKTYYWRVDEVNAAPDNTIFKGQAWNFTVEPFGYPITNVTATASSAQPGMSPQNTVNRAGLNADDQHSTEPTQMWMSTGAKPNWIQYELDGVYKLHQLLVWNSNQLIEGFLGFGAKDVTIEYSVDGATWAALEDVPQFAKASGTPTYTANTTVDMGGVMAKYVKLTVNANWGGMTPQTGLAEVRFFYVPVRAREPIPADGTTEVGVDVEFGWRPGREAQSHEVYLGTDQAAMAKVGAPTGHSYTPASLDFGKTYYWRVDEIGGAGPYEGDVWSFATQEYADIDDFEAYTDDIDAQATIWHAWIDGLTTGASGSQVGYDVAPFAEKKIVHGGGQSMPVQYDNSASPFLSEAERTFAPAENWTTNGADSLVVYFRGEAPGFVQLANGNIVMSAVGTDIWNNADQFRYAYKTLNGDGTMVARVESIAQSNVWAKGGVMIRQSIEPGSTHAFMPITASGGNGASFQRRLMTDGGSSNNDSTTAVSAPYWVMIQRKGNAFSGYISPDGTTWTQLGAAETITMTGPVLIGLALCSHEAAITTAAEFSNISTTGNVSGAWQLAEIGAAQPAGNSLEGLYVSVKDTSGKSKVVQHPDAAATGNVSWQQWSIPLSEFTSAGVKMNAVKSIVIGVGAKAAPKAGGTGIVYVDDIGYGHAKQ